VGWRYRIDNANYFLLKIALAKRKAAPISEAALR
jgi:hypothetical protein